MLHKLSRTIIDIGFIRCVFIVGLSAFLLNGAVAICGGYTSQNRAIDTFDEYRHCVLPAKQNLEKIEIIKVNSKDWFYISIVAKDKDKCYEKIMVNNLLQRGYLYDSKCNYYSKLNINGKIKNMYVTLKRNKDKVQVLFQCI